jgi:ABC-2 type transport system ATP-binding protein
VCSSDLDEPTSSLDPRQRADVHDLISGLRGSHTVILSTHILPEVSAVADRVAIVSRGRILAVDTPERLGERLRGREVVSLECATPAGGVEASDIRGALAVLAGVGDVSVEAGPAATWTVRFDSPVGTDLRADAAAVIVARGWRLLRLAGESLSLQDIFLQLTSEDGNAGSAAAAKPRRAGEPDV